jgi:type VI secretion system secreted protein VgrG
VDWAAAKKISLSTAGGANITIEGGNITIQCPGKITVHAGQKSFAGPTQQNYPMPKLPRAPIDAIPLKFDMRLQDVPGLQAEPYPNTEWRVIRADSSEQALGSEDEILTGSSDDDGNVKLRAAEEKTLQDEYNKTPNKLWLVANSHARELVIAVQKPDWSNSDKFYHGLNALGYTDDHATTNGVDVEDFFAPLAREELQTTSGTSLFKKIKKG